MALIKPHSETTHNSFQILEMLQNIIPPQIQLQQPVIFKDALDRVAPIHLAWITSWEAFHAVLKVRFKDRGLKKVERLEFVVQSGLGHQIDFSENWASSIRAGDHVDMSMVFEAKEQTLSSQCPACQHDCGGDIATEIKWYVLSQ